VCRRTAKKPKSGDQMVTLPCAGPECTRQRGHGRRRRTAKRYRPAERGARQRGDHGKGKSLCRVRVHSKGQSLCRVLVHGKGQILCRVLVHGKVSYWDPPAAPSRPGRRQVLFYAVKGSKAHGKVFAVHFRP
jgi:hypothetical protein